MAGGPETCDGFKTGLSAPGGLVSCTPPPLSAHAKPVSARSGSTAAGGEQPSPVTGHAEARTRGMPECVLRAATDEGVDRLPGPGPRGQVIGRCVFVSRM
jgi:hypothetical protein